MSNSKTGCIKCPSDAAWCDSCNLKEARAEINRLKAELQAKPVVDSELVERLQEAYQNAFEHYGAHYNNLVVEVDMSDLHEAITALQQKPVENKND